MAKTAAESKQIKEIIIAVVMVLLAVGFFVFFRPGAPKKTATVVPVEQIQTTFDQSALDKLKEQQTNYPSVDPAASDLGKSNPFGG